MAKLELEISEELEQQLSRDAVREGVSVMDLAIRRLMQGSTPRNLAEAIRPYIVGNANEYDTLHSSRESGNQFADYVVDKKANGHL